MGPFCYFKMLNCNAWECHSFLKCTVLGTFNKCTTFNPFPSVYRIFEHENH